MLSVQNSETWALSQANPKTEPIFPPKPTRFFPKTEPLCPKNGACFSQKRNMFFPKKRSMFFPKTELPKVDGWFPQSRWRISPKSVADFP